MTNQFDPRELRRLIEDAGRAMSKLDLTVWAREVEEARRAMRDFDPTVWARQVEEARRAMSEFDPNELALLVEEARRAMSEFDPNELALLVDETRRGALALLVDDETRRGTAEARRALEQLDHQDEDLPRRANQRRGEIGETTKSTTPKAEPKTGRLSRRLSRLLCWMWWVRRGAEQLPPELTKLLAKLTELLPPEWTELLPPEWAELLATPEDGLDDEIIEPEAPAGGEDPDEEQ